jgi:3-phosphoshikimate 1-carboxyvinyltransferase
VTVGSAYSATLLGLVKPEDLQDPYPIEVRGPLSAAVRPPGSRSVTNRALLCAALAPGVSEVIGAGENDDTEAMRRGLRGLGAKIREAGDGWRVDGCGGVFPARNVHLDVGASGTTARFLTAAASLARGPITIDGSARMRERPIADLVDGMQALGAEARIDGMGGCPPVRVDGGGLPGGTARIDASRSSQFVSGLLLAAPCATRDVELIFRDGAVVSWPFLELTSQVMTAFGAAPKLTRRGARVSARGYRPARYEVEPDPQSAVYAFCAAAISGGSIHVRGIPSTSQQTDLALLDVLAQMGCAVSRESDAVRVSGAPAGLRAVDVDMNHIPDAVLALAVVALFAEGTTHLRNIANLRIKETDRLKALETELRRLGATAEAGDDSLSITPAPLHGAVVETYEDHRMAMSFALAGLRVPGIEIRDPSCVSKTWPDYFEFLSTL